ncbi:MAG: MSHA biogenesis protein MshP [Phenylobacterium sp.]|jgi:MSHA biogenesis protein MshP
MFLNRSKPERREKSRQSSRRKQRHSRAKQRGSMLVIAVFILTVMMLIATTMMDVLSDSANAVAYEVYGTRALSAANSGAELAMQQIFPYDGAAIPVVCPVAANYDATVEFALNLSGSNHTGFTDCTVAVQCLQFEVAETGYTHYRIESTATCGSGDFSTVRTVALEARQR